MDRPCRKTRVVNYCENKDFDDDEDFACAKEPPSKKTKEEVKQEQKKPSSKETNSQSTQSDKNRKPLDNKLYERDLEAAITLSLLNNSDGLKEQPPVSKDVKIQIPIDENTDPASLCRSNCSVDATVMGLDKITSESGSPASAKQRRASSKASKVQRKEDEDDDDDYQPKLTPGSESDDDYSEPAESEDEEFKVKKVIKSKKKDQVTKKDKNKPSPASKTQKQPAKASKFKSQAAASTPVTGSAPPNLPLKRPASSITRPTSKPAASLSPAGGRIPTWNPPGQIGKSPTSSQSPAVKSPGQGLRLGLSRRVPVKPLHPSVASR